MPRRSINQVPRTSQQVGERQTVPLPVRRQPATASAEPSRLAQEANQRGLGNRATVALLEQAPTQHASEPAPTRRMIRYGSSGADVSCAQQRLNLHGAAPPLATDGVFGPLTRQATLDYQRSHGLDVDAIVGPRTWASLDGPATIGGASGSSGGGGAGGPGSTVMMYDTGTQSFSPPAKGTTMATIRTEIKAKQDVRPDPELGKTVDVKGVTAGTPEEIWVWNVLLQRAERANWGGEIDVVTQIGPEKEGKKPVGQVTVKIDGSGNATAILLSRGPVAVPNALPDEKTAIAALKALGFSTVENGSARWTLPELNKVHAALARLGPGERSALSGVRLVREQTLTSASGKPLDGQFRHAIDTTKGDAGTASVASRSESLHLADSAFSGDRIGFIGDASDAALASFHVIVHEAGHAVEGKARRDAQFARAQAQAVVNNDTFALNARQDGVNTAVTAMNTAIKTAVPKFARYGRKEQSSAGSYIAAVEKATQSIDAYANGDKVNAFRKQQETAAKAMTDRDAKRAALPEGHPAAADTADVITTQDTLFSAARGRATAFTKLEASKEALAERKAEEAKVTKGDRSNRLAAFVDFVTRNKIPPLTAYAKQSWPSGPEEFYAEAFSLWLNDPTYLKDNAPKLKDWFDAGKHLG
ncbi:MAG: peptidoglycan-binding domain-containing protein [Propionicimonas sp.]